MLQLTFSGSTKPVLVAGELYLKLKIIESVRLEFDGGVHEDNSTIGRRVHEVHEHLERKHEL